MNIEKNIQEETSRRARSYTPEWRFDMENPDIGSALAMAFAAMTAETVKQFSKIPKKNRIAFFNGLGAEILPAVPAQGYLQFSLLNEEVPGVTVETGTVVSVEEEEQAGGPVDFKTCEDVYVTPAVVSDIYQTCDKEDGIYRIYDRQSMEFQPFSLFASRTGNLQTHEMYISHDVLFYIQSEAVIFFTGFGKGNRRLAPECFHQLADKEQAVFEYYSEDGWTPFASLEAREDGIDLYKEEAQKGFAKTVIAGRESYWIRLRLFHFQEFSQLHPTRLEVSVRNRGQVPDTIYGAWEECNPARFLPFGEGLTLYQELYFGSEEVFSKKGARITCSYQIDYRKIPLERYEKQEINWQWIMNQEQMREESEYEVCIESVLWEYYNGSGWTRLFADETGSAAFSLPGKGEGHYRTISFICPQDMERTLVNATETYYIRARVMKIQHLYQITGYYLVPVLENLSVRYTYGEHALEPQEYVFHNNMEYVRRQGELTEKESVFFPFSQTGEENMAMYIGLEGIPLGSPVKMLFSMAEDIDCSSRPLVWEYWNGTAWKNLHPADETEYFSRTGILSFSGNRDMKTRKLFGRKRCWLRILVQEQTYTLLESPQRCPVIQGIYMNAVAVQSVLKTGERTPAQAESGTQGNLPAGRTWKMERSIGYIHRVANPEAMTGGYHGESPEDAMERIAGSIRHQQRAVSVEDYEQLARCAVRGIRMVKCFSGYDDTGKPARGAVTLVVLPEQSGQQTMVFAPVQEKIMQYMKERLSSTLADSRRFFVIPPQQIEVRLHIECIAEEHRRPYEIKKAILEKLKLFFRPWDFRTGQGWEIGSFPSVMQIQNAVSDIADIEYIRRIRMSAYTGNTGCQREIDVETVKRQRYILPVNGRHEIFVFM